MLMFEVSSQNVEPQNSVLFVSSFSANVEDSNDFDLNRGLFVQHVQNDKK